MNTKYIIIEIENVGVLPIIFYGMISHNDMLTSIRIRILIVKSRVLGLYQLVVLVLKRMVSLFH